MSADPRKPPSSTDDAAWVGLRTGGGAAGALCRRND